jgi:hypothetical protein
VVCALGAVAAIATPSVVGADAAVPQQSSPCSENLAGALTQLPDQRTLLECASLPGLGYQWQSYDNPYPNSDRWLTYGPTLTLHGEGQRNREINSGDWTGYPQDGAGQCVAEQTVVLGAGDLGPPQVATGAHGLPLRFQLLPLLFTVELSGNCLWQKAE